MRSEPKANREFWIISGLYVIYGDSPSIAEETGVWVGGTHLCHLDVRVWSESQARGGVGVVSDRQDWASCDFSGS